MAGGIHTNLHRGEKSGRGMPIESVALSMKQAPPLGGFISGVFRRRDGDIAVGV